MAKLFSDELRQAIEKSELSCYAICQITGIDKAQMSRFINGKGGLSMEGTDAVCKLIGAKLVPGKPVKVGRRK
jgi:Cro/C1-type HTH DNA-binding domain